MQVRLARFCQARSGDKADNVNVAVFAPTGALYEVLREQVTESAVAGLLAPLVQGTVTRYEVPNVRALNFVCTHALAGGGPRSLRSDNLGKCFGPALLRLEVDVDPALLEGVVDLTSAPVS